MIARRTGATNAASSTDVFVAYGALRSVRTGTTHGAAAGWA